MNDKEKKEFILSVVEDDGGCYESLNDPAYIYCAKECVFTGKPGCFAPKDAYKMAIDWAITYCKEDLLEILI